MNTTINQELYKVLSTIEDKYFINQELNKNKVIQDLEDYDPELLQALLSNNKIKKYFTMNIEGHTILQTNKLIELFELNDYWKSSYTRYSKKIGLTTYGKFIDESNDVVLDFPYKDAVLKASMSKEDTEQDGLRPDEPFLNEVIAKEEIDVLLDKKILINAKKFGKNNVENIDCMDSGDNLIIKGNNLLVLHTLKENYQNKIQLIYIDPPYNTGNDSFTYNDKFHRSTWLTFMKNRLEVSRELLKESGVILVQCDDHEIGYLSLLMDDIFGEENKICIFPRVTKKGGKSSSDIAKNHDYMLLYSKSKDTVTLHAPEHNDDGFCHKDEYFEERGFYKLNQTLDYDSLQYSSSLDYPIDLNGEIFYPGGDKVEYLRRQKGEHERADWAWRWSKKLFLYGLENGFIQIKEGRDRKRIYTKTYQNAKLIQKGSEGYTIEKIVRTKPLSTLEFIQNKYSNDNATKHARELGINNLFEYTKPESLIEELIKFTTTEKDIVLDFFLGSGTTAAVAHKMNRQYICIEQMDYIHTVTVQRLQKVIEGEQGGISESAGWQGGGDFIYAELMEKNHRFITLIQQAENSKELQEVFDFMLKESEIDFRVDLAEIKDTLNELSFREQKKVLFAIVDKNQLYYNYSEIDDGNVRDLISDEDYAFNKSFYEDGGE